MAGRKCSGSKMPPRPTPGSGELLIRVHAASVNPIDWKVRAGYMKDYIPLPLPFIPGWDVSGVVEAAGSGVTKDRKSTRLNSSHTVISYAVFCLKKKKKTVNESCSTIR